MKRVVKRRGILRDDHAQALTEYVVVIPVVLFAFFACFETMVLAQTSQMANYASFAAARSYATSVGYFVGEGNNATDARDEAEDRAKNTACFVMAPVSHAQMGEARRLTVLGADIPLLDFTRGLVANLPQIVKEFYGIAEGFLVAYIYRIKDFSCSESGGVVTCTFDYLCPMAIPGFVELWTYLFDKGGGGKEAHHEFDVGAPVLNPAELNSAINQIFDALIAIGSVTDALGIDALDGFIDGIRDTVNTVISEVYSVGVAGAEYNVTLKVKSVCGFETWSGTVRDGDNEERCEGNVDPAAQACVDAMEGQQAEIDRLTAIASNECYESHLAQITWSNKNEILIIKEQELQTCKNTATNPVVQCAPQQLARDEAFLEERSAYSDAEDEKDECEDANSDVTDASESPDECDF